ncbi:MAG: methionine--tRNA ligase [Deltaproteobacteria bacterium]|jgi:methionyl-tRNA synthetase|nr:methionine--tRNA ligase [Deltaproteobacteria bacterium]
MSKSTFYVTTPIFYPNAKPHLGHSFTSIVADSITRFQRLMGMDSMMLTGTDEHGDKLAQTAAKEGVTPQELVDANSPKFRQLMDKLSVGPHRFVRSTDPHHTAKVRDFLQLVYDKGDIYFGEYGGHYCTGCERFYTEKELENGLCPQHLKAPEYISEKNYFFRMSKYADWLRQHILDNPDFIQPEQYRKEVLAILDSGELEDLCISRPKTRLTWGIDLPFDKDYVCYVWFDALLCYLTPLNWPDGEEYKKYWPGHQHIIGKDILKPHGIFWPTMLKSAGLELYRRVNVHGYWLVRDTKMSKSLGNVVDPLDMIDTYGVDVFRYFLMRDMTFGQDASFSEEGLVGRFNSDLANDLGNLFSRVLSMAARYFDGQSPAVGAPGEAEKQIQALAANSFRNFQSLFDKFRFSNGLEALWELVRALNKYVDASAPWALHREGKTRELGTVIHTLLDIMRKVALHLWPVMPGTAEKLLAQLGQTIDPDNTNLADEADTFGLFPAGVRLASSSNLFPRIEENKEAQPARNAKKEKAGTPDKKADPIEFADFEKIDLRVGTILSAEKHPDADKILCFKVDLGEETPRSIVSGIAQYFAPADLQGKQVIVVANLPCRRIRNVESQGMLLTAEDETGLTLVAPDGHKAPGTRIY